MRDKTAVLVVSFGTSYRESLDRTIGAIEEGAAKINPEWEVRRAFTSRMIVDKLKKRDGLFIDNVGEALKRAAKEGVKTLILQPTHIMSGLEYRDLAAEAEKYRADFSRLAIGKPLLSDERDFDRVTAAITKLAGEYDDGETAVIFMGHGSEAKANEVYEILQTKLIREGFSNYYIGTVEARPDLLAVIRRMKKEKHYKKAVLIPLMVVCGDHANNDMAGDDEDSWKSVLEQEGYEVSCILQGLGELPAIRAVYEDHIREAFETGRI